MFNCVAVKKWKRLVAWFPSHGVNCTVDMECNFSRKHNVFMLLRILKFRCLCIVLLLLRKIDVFLKKKQLEIQQRQLGKMHGDCESRGLDCVCHRKNRCVILA